MLTPRQTFEEHSHDLELTLAGNLATSSNSSKLKTEWKHVWTTTATIILQLLYQKQCCVHLLVLWERPSQDFIHGSGKPLKVSFRNLDCWCLSAITSPWPIPVLSQPWIAPAAGKPPDRLPSVEAKTSAQPDFPVFVIFASKLDDRTPFSKPLFACHGALFILDGDIFQRLEYFPECEIFFALQVSVTDRQDLWRGFAELGSLSPCH